MKIHIKDKQVILVLILLIFITPYYLRVKFLGSVGKINLLFSFIIFLLVCLNIKKIKIYSFILYLFAILYILINNYFVDSNIYRLCFEYLFYLYPFILLFLTLDSKNINKIFQFVLKIYNCIIVLILIIGILDPLISFKIMRTYADFIQGPLSVYIYSGTKLSQYRYTSYMGHPLLTKDLFLYCFLLNYIYNTYNKKPLLKDAYLILICLIGVLITASKSGIISLLTTIFIGYSRKKDLRKIILFIGIIIFVLSFDSFQYVFSRFDSNNLTTGRFDSLNVIFKDNIFKIHMFYGYGERLLDSIKSIYGGMHATASTEIPFITYLLKYGMIGGLFIYSYIFILPIINIFKSYNMRISFIFLMIILNLNTYNGILFHSDAICLYSLLILVITSYGKQLRITKNIKIEAFKEG